jgi:hypothetical protein
MQPARTWNCAPHRKTYAHGRPPPGVCQAAVAGRGAAAVRPLIRARPEGRSPRAAPRAAPRPLAPTDRARRVNTVNTVNTVTAVHAAYCVTCVYTVYCVNTVHVVNSVSPRTWDCAAEAAENTDNGPTHWCAGRGVGRDSARGRKQADGGNTAGVLDSKAQGGSPFSACFACSAVKKQRCGANAVDTIRVAADAAGYCLRPGSLTSYA